MTDVRVVCQPAGEGWACRVTVSEPSGSTTQHGVTVSRAEIRRLVGDVDDPRPLVQASFAYLLERETKESILRSFAIGDIERYFPDYPREIGERLSRAKV